MKDVKDEIVTSILEDKTDPVKLLKELKDLTVEDIIIIYAYADAILKTVREHLVVLNAELRIKNSNQRLFWYA